MTSKKDLVAIVLVAILSFFAVQPLFSPGYFSMHDNQQVVRLFELNKALLAGQFPVRLVEGLGFGLSYTLFNFYPPMAYYVGEIFHLLGFGLIDSVKIVCFLAIVGSGIAMYFLAKNFFGRAGGVLAAMFYVYAPYHAVDAYVRGALAELSSFVWLPLILLFAWKTAKFGQTKYALWTGFFLALLMLTHNLIFLPFLGIFTLWFVAMALIHKQKILLAASNWLLATVLCFGLTAFFWLPALWEKQYTLVDGLLIKNLASYKIHFLCPEQLWNSPWGFGGSGVGCTDGVSFKVGKLHIFVSILALGIALINKKSRHVILTSFSLLLLSAFMTTENSKIIWDNIRELWYIQFPWRFLEFIVLFSSFLAGSIVLATKKTVFRAAIAGALVTLLLFQNAKLFAPQTIFPNATDKSLTTKEQVEWEISSTSFEFLPKGIATKINELGVLWVDINKSDLQSKKYNATNLEVTAEHFEPHGFRLTTKSSKKGEIQFQITHFPGWKVWLDGLETKFSDNNKFKLITVEVPAGTHEITGQFENTPVRTVGNLVTLVSLICLISLLLIAYGFGRNRK